MARPKKCSDEILLAAYRECGTLSATGVRLGMTSQGVSWRLKQIGVSVNLGWHQARKQGRLSDEEVLAAYRDTRSIHLAADRLGISFQGVYSRLRRLREPMRPMKPWTGADVDLMRREYADHARRGRLSDLAVRLGRPVACLYTKAGSLGLRDTTHLGAYQHPAEEVSDAVAGHP